MTKPSSQIAPPEEGPLFVDPAELPRPSADDVCFVQVLNGKVIAKVAVAAGDYDDATLRAIAWEWWYGRLEASEQRATSPSRGETRQPRHLELL